MKKTTVMMGLDNQRESLKCIYMTEGVSSEAGGELGNEKAVLMPNREELTKKLQKAKTLGISPQSDRFLNSFIESIANSEKVGMGLVLAWELSMYDTLREYPPQVQAAMDLYFDNVIDLVTPDPEVAAQAKEYRKQVLEYSRENP